MSTGARLPLGKVGDCLILLSCLSKVPVFLQLEGLGKSILGVHKAEEISTIIWSIIASPCINHVFSDQCFYLASVYSKV